MIGGESLRRLQVARLLMAACLVWPISAAHADPEVGDESRVRTQSAAESLFLEGKRLMAEREYAKACGKFAESQRLDPAPGTLLNLADCYEKNGQTASAWVAFREAKVTAERSGRTAWAEQSAARAEILEKELSTLTVEVSASAGAEGLEVLCDGAPVASGTWGVPVPIDPSTVTIVARAPGKKGWETRATVDAEHRHVVVAVPALEDAPAPVAIMAGSGEEAPRRFRWTAQRVGGVSSVVAGIGGFAVASGFAVAATGLESQARRESYPAQFNDSTRANQEGNVATGFLVGGAVAVAAGVVLWVTDPKGRSWISFGDRAFGVGGRF